MDSQSVRVLRASSLALFAAGLTLAIAGLRDPYVLSGALGLFVAGVALGATTFIVGADQD
jgi:hypothetical protein